MTNKRFFALISIFLLGAFSQPLSSLPLKFTKGFDRLLVQDKATADFLDPLIGGVIFQKNQDLIENLFDYGQTKQTLARIDTEKGTHETVNVPSHPFALLAQRMFHRPTQNVRFIPTRVDPFFKSTTNSIEKQLYVLGWLCALVTEGKSIGLQVKHYLALSKKIYDTPNKKTIERLLRKREKAAPDILHFTESCRDLLKITDIFLPAEIVRLVLNACIMGSRKIGLSKSDTVKITVYQKNLPLILISSYAYAQAQSKHDLAEFVHGFFDHCSNRDLIFTPEGIKVFSSAKEQATFEQIVYTKEDIKKISEFESHPQPLYHNPITQFIGAIFLHNHPSHAPAQTPAQADEAPQKPTASDLLFIGAQSTEQTDNCNIKTQSGHTCDCAECGILFLVKNILLNDDTEQYDLSRLPEEVQNSPFVKEFPEKFQRSINDLSARTWWFYLFSDKEGQHNKADFVYANPKHFYELEPEAENVRKALALFFGIKAATFAELGQKLSSDRQTVQFAIEENVHDNHDKVKITMSITTHHDQSTKESVIVVDWHQHIAIKEKESFNKWAFNRLIQNTINKTTNDFPFNILFFDADMDMKFLFLHSFAGNGFDALCKMGISENNKDKSARQKTRKELFNLESINFATKEPKFLTNPVIEHCLDHLYERPYKNLLESLDPADLLKLLNTDKKAHAFLQKVDPEWVKTNACELAPQLFGPQNINYPFMEDFAQNPTTTPYRYFVEQIKPEFILLGLCDSCDANRDNFLRIMGSDWFTKQAFALWERVKDSSEALRVITRHLRDPLMSSMVDAIGVDVFLKQIITTDSFKGFSGDCYFNWYCLHIENIWHAIKENPDALKIFMPRLFFHYNTVYENYRHPNACRTTEIQDAFFAHISLQKLIVKLSQANLLKKIIKKCKDPSHGPNNSSPWRQLFLDKCEELKICIQNPR